MKTPNQTTAKEFVGGNEEIRTRPMWVIAKAFNEASKELNGQVTSVNRHKSTKQPRRILG